MNIVQKTALVLTVIGALNWGLIGLFNFDLVATLFGSMTIISRTIYTLVGIAGLINIMLFFIQGAGLIMVTKEQVVEALEGIVDPFLHKTLKETGAIK